MGELCDRQIPVAYFSAGGWFRRVTTGLPSKNVELRIEQYRKAADAAFCLRLARVMTVGKIENQRTMVRRNHEDPPAIALEDLRLAARAAAKAASLETLLGVEGNAAKAYFGCFQGMIRARGEEGAENLPTKGHEGARKAEEKSEAGSQHPVDRSQK